MPEIWLKYGNTQVALNIKLENLQAEISPEVQNISEDEIIRELHSIPLSSKTLVLTLSESPAVNRVASMLSQMSEAKGYQPPEIKTLERAVTHDPEKGFNIGTADSPLYLNKQYSDVVFISRVSYDPLFGFSGTPTLLLRRYMYSQMLKAYESRNCDIPTPGARCPPLEEALTSSSSITAYSLEVVESGSIILGVFAGKVADAFRKAIENLSSTEIAVEQTKSLILSGTDESDIDLSTSLNLLWNSAHVIQEEGSAVLLAENRRGLGKGALKMFLEGKLRVDDIARHGFYTEGLEHLLYLQNLRERYQLGILSTLPQWYLSKLGLESYRGTRELLSRLLSRYGKKSKILVSRIGYAHLLKTDRDVR